MTEPAADTPATEPHPATEAVDKALASGASQPTATAEPAPAERVATETAPPADAPGMPDLAATAGPPAPAAPAPILDAADRPGFGSRFRRGTFEALLARLRADNVLSYRRYALATTALLVTLGVGYGGGRLTARPAPVLAPSDARLADALTGLRQSHEDVLRLGTELKSLKTAVDSVRTERDKARGEIAAKQAQLSERLDKLGSESLARLERIEKNQRDPARYAALIEKLDRLERGASPGPVAAIVPPPAPSSVVVASSTPAPVAAATPTPPPKPAAAAAADTVTQTGSIQPPKAEPDPRKTQLDGWSLRDLDDGDYALVENKQGRLFEVMPGTNLPGIGRVEAIERRGRHWVVVTPKGFIAER